jgi:hypothetical protein
LIPTVSEKVTVDLDNLKIIIEGAFLTDSVADMWVKSPITISLEQISDTDLAKDELLDLCSNQNTF